MQIENNEIVIQESDIIQIEELELQTNIYFNCCRINIA